RRLQDEGEGAVLVDRDLDWDDRAAHRLGGGVVLLAELHRLHAVGPERGTNRRRGRCSTRFELDLYYCDNVLGHGRSPVSSLQLRDLREVELHGGLSSKDVHQHLDLELVFVDFGDVTREGREGTGLDLHRVVDLELVRRHATLRGGLLDAFDVRANDVV